MFKPSKLYANHFQWKFYRKSIILLNKSTHKFFKLDKALKLDDVKGRS